MAIEPASVQRFFEPDFLQSVGTTRTIIANGTEVPSPDETCFQLTDGLALDASIRVRDKLSPHIEVTTGTLLGIDDLLNTSLCETGFFMPPLEEDDPSLELHYEVHSGEDWPSRFIDYHALGDLDTAAFERARTPRRPVDAWRLDQGTLLSHLSRQWVLLHELSHWLMGHSLITQGHRISEISHHISVLEPAIDGSAFSVDEKRCVELQADGLAFELLWHSLLCQEMPDSVWEAFLDACPTHPDGLEDVREPEGRIRALMIAAGGMALLFEKARLQTKALGVYPRPLTRLVNLFATAIRLIGTYSHTLSENDEGDLVLDPDKLSVYRQPFEQLSSGLLMAFEDLAIMARILAVQSSLEKDPAEPLSHPLSDIFTGTGVFLPDIDSLMHLRLSPALRGANKAAMTEYQQLLSVQPALNDKLRDVALIEI